MKTPALVRPAVVAMAALATLPVCAADHPVVAALGGSRALGEIRTLSYTLEVTDLATGDVVTTKQFLDFRHRRLYRQDVGKGSVLVRASNGLRGWRRDASGMRALDETEAGELITSMHYNFLFLFAQPETRLTVVSSGEAAALGPAYRVEAPGLIDPFVIVTDAKGRIAHLFFGAGARGRELDWRPVAGLYWPFQYEISKEGIPVRQGRFADFEVNPPIPRALFAGLPPRRAHAP